MVSAGKWSVRYWLVLIQGEELQNRSDIIASSRNMQHVAVVHPHALRHQLLMHQFQISFQ